MSQQDRSRREGASVAELLARAIEGGPSDPKAHAAVGVLQHRATREVLEAAVALTHSPKAQARARAAEILGQLGVPERAFPEECRSALVELFRAEQSVEVLCACAQALGHLHDGRVVPELVRHASHPHALVRGGVAFGLLGHEDEQAVQALISLSRDPDDDVRDWAAFGLGSQIDLDRADLRAALFARLEDPHAGVRNEALLGLARRKDGRVVPALLRELRGKAVSRLAVEAALEIADLRLHGALESLSRWWEEDDDLIALALLRCSPSSRRES